MSNVAYLLGAGASAECIPIVKNMAKDISQLRSDLHQPLAIVHNSVYGEDRSKRNIAHQFGDTTLSNLIEICKNHFSVDTYAKKLYLTDRDAFEKLKKDLCFYFTLVQNFRIKDKRYDNFFSSIITEMGQLPPRVKILSWNYDYQLELSHSEFVSNKSLTVNRELLNISSPSSLINPEKYENVFSVLKLNGSATFKSSEGYNYLSEGGEYSPLRISQIFLDYFKLINSQSDVRTDLQFAWENERYETIFRAFGPELSKIDVLVVVGYSFPFFNRSVDIMLFDRMRKLKKIYVQDKNPEGIREVMEEFVRFKRRDSIIIEFVGKENLEQFVFPRELDISGPESHSIEKIAE